MFVHAARAHARLPSSSVTGKEMQLENTWYVGYDEKKENECAA